LIELLVVIAIIAILASIIFPVYSRARAKARSARCMANLKQVGMAFEMYTQDYDDLYPWAIDPADANCPQIWNGYPDWQAWIPYMPQVSDVLQPYIRNAELFHCPSDTGYDELDDADIPIDGRPTGFAAFGTSYFYRTEITFRRMITGSFADPTAPNMYFDAHGGFHGGWSQGSYRYNVLFPDGHVKSLNAGQMDEAWMTSLTE
jgi:general secretion pathway protein G